MIRLVNNIKDAKYITHNGTMHADEVFATAFLHLYKKNLDLIRVGEINSEDYQDKLIYDVGRGDFDHHQENRRLRDNNIPYCSLGLLWEEYGRAFLQENNYEYVDEIWRDVDKDFIEGIDAIDNGIFPKVEAEYKIRNLCDVIKLFNPSFNSNEEEASQFLKAVDVAEKIFQEELLNVSGKVKARKILESKIEEAKKKHYLCLDEYMPYEESVYANDEEKEIYFVIYPSNRGGYAAKIIYNSAEDHTARVSFPREWAGLGNELAEVSGVGEATFCHLGLFIVCAKTKEAIINLVNIAISKSDKSGPNTDNLLTIKNIKDNIN